LGGFVVKRNKLTEGFHREGGRAYVPITKRARAIYLEQLSRGLTLRAAAELAGHPRESFVGLRRRDPVFAELEAGAREAGTDFLEDEIRKRAIEGFDEPVVGKVAPGIDGHVLGPDGEPMYLRRYSDRLAEVLIKGRRPEYRENPRVDITNQTLSVTVEDRSAALSEVARVLAEAGVDFGGIVVEGEAREIVGELDGGGGDRQVVPGSEGVLAEPSDV
jgi:hypothetical protein